MFAVVGPVHRIAVPPLALAQRLLLGGLAGAIVVRHAPVRPLRWVIALPGFGLAIYLAVSKYA